MKRVAGVGIVLLAFWSTVIAADLRLGDSAPMVKLKTDSGANFDLNARKGQWTVLYFYPKADTPGCTKQACAFRDNISQIRKLGAEIYGVSADSVEAVRNFRKKHSLNFVLLADPGLEAIGAYGTRMGTMNMSQRWTFIIGPDLRIRAIEKDVDPVMDAVRTAAKLKELQARS